MALTKGAADAPDSSEFSDRDLLIAALDGIMALSRQLGGGELVLRVVSARTGRTVDVQGSALATFTTKPEASAPGSVPVHAALRPAGK